MSVVLLIKDSRDAPDRLIPVATQARFVARWVRGATALGLEWVPLAETGFDVTAENRGEVARELVRLRAWFVAQQDTHCTERLDRLLEEIRALRFEDQATAFFG